MQNVSQRHTESYNRWITKNDTPTASERIDMLSHAYKLQYRPRISVLMRTYNTPSALLREAIDSVCGQFYGNWELCIADDASTLPHVKDILMGYQSRDPRIKACYRDAKGDISAASNSALDLATGEFVAVLDHADKLSLHALYHVAVAFNEYPGAKIVYSDEDKLDESGKRFDPHFKPDWNPDLLYSQNYISHLGVYDAALVREIGGFRIDYEGGQDYDLLLRCVARCQDDEIIHVPKVLYHRRCQDNAAAQDTDEKRHTADVAIRALRDYFISRGEEVTVHQGIGANTYRVQHAIPEPAPLVSLLIPTRDKLDLINTCVGSILKKTTYPNYEILILDNQSAEARTLEWFDDIQSDSRIRVLRYDHPFNYSAINNFGAKHARGEFLGLVNNDIEVISEEWLSEMVSHAVRPKIGCVGAKLYYDDNTIQHAGVILGVGGVASHSHKRFPREAPGYFQRLLLIQNLSAVTAACLLVKKSIYEEVSGLNENDLTVAYNDVDFCLRVHEAGYRNLWTPYAELYHHESISRGAEDTPEKKARFTEEQEYMKRTWGKALDLDSAYNCNLTLSRVDFSLR